MTLELILVRIDGFEALLFSAAIALSAWIGALPRPTPTLRPRSAP
jgi:hypothetical protein